MSINVLERTREIGVLRAIGAPNRSVASVFVLEGIIIGLMSWAMGAAVAIPMSRGLNQALGQAVVGYRHPFEYSGQFHTGTHRFSLNSSRSACLRIMYMTTACKMTVMCPNMV